jgi:hypothetical protein
MRAAILLATVACTPDVPAEPSFQQDVLPILAANCVRCHGYPAIGGAPETFRLDVLGDTAVVAGEPRDPPVCGGDPGDPAAELVLCGAASYAFISALRVRDEQRPMPPRFTLADHQIEILERWAQAPERGDPRPDNRAPTVAVEVLGNDGAVLVIRVETDDADRDLVVGTLRLQVAGAMPLVGPIRSGIVELRFDPGAIPAGDYPLLAAVDDGAALHELMLGTLTIGGS